MAHLNACYDCKWTRANGNFSHESRCIWWDPQLQKMPRVQQAGQSVHQRQVVHMQSACSPLPFQFGPLTETDKTRRPPRSRFARQLRLSEAISEPHRTFVTATFFCFKKSTDTLMSTHHSFSSSPFCNPEL